MCRIFLHIYGIIKKIKLPFNKGERMLVIPSIPAGKMKDQEYDYFYDDEQDAEYCYPGTNILKN